MDYKKALPLIDKFLGWVSLKRVLLLGFMAVVMITTLTVFENRTQLSEGIADRGKERNLFDEPIKLSKSSEEQIKTVTKGHAEILMISVISVNMRVLQRTPVYVYSGDVQIQKMVDNQLAARTGTIPVFTKDEKADADMVSLMNGDFSCVKYGDTVNATIFPALAGRVKQLCRIGLPPYKGNFAGYISVMLSDMTGPYKEDEIRLELTKLATDIYLSDVVSRRTH
jgi:hypothetical protein